MNPRITGSCVVGEEFYFYVILLIDIVGDRPETEDPAPKRFATCDENDSAVVLAGRVPENVRSYQRINRFG